MPRRRILIPASLVVAIAALLLIPYSVPEVDQPADPLLWIREPAVKFLRSCDVLDKTLPDPLLPSEEEGGSVWYGPGDEETWDGIVHLRREPVYRGLAVREGTRVTIEQEVAEHVRSVRIAVGVGEDPDLGEPGVRIGKSDVPGYDLWRVQAFVPEGRYWYVVAPGDDGRWPSVMWLGATRPVGSAPDIAHAPAGN